jgi:hypothetical protein
MRWTGTCHPEWGYLAASRRSTWKMRLFMLATAVGATATGATCCSILYRPLAAEASVAERTLTPADRTAGPEKATETSQANVRTDACSPADPGRVDDAGPLPPDGAAPRTRGRPDCPNRAQVDGPSSGLAAANVGAAMADRSAISASQNRRPSISAASTAPVGPLWRAPIKGAQAVVPTAPRYGSYAAGYQLWYSARQRGSYGLQSKYGSYSNRQYQ